MVEKLLSKVKSGMKSTAVKTTLKTLLVGTLLASTVMAQDVSVTGNYADQKQRPIPEAQAEYYRDGIVYSYVETDFNGNFELWSPPLAIGPEINITRGNFITHNWAEPMVSMTQFYTQVEEPGTITITDLLGRYVTSAPLEQMHAYHVEWGGKNVNGMPVASGFYNYTVLTGTYQQTGSIILLKGATPTGGLIATPQQYGSVQIAEKMIIDFQRQENQNSIRKMQKKANNDIQVSENGSIYKDIQEHTGNKGQSNFEETGPDSVIFTKDNTTRLVYVLDPPETPIDLGTINGNIGPTASDIPIQNVDPGEIIETNLNEYVDNDEDFSFYIPRDEPLFVMSSDSTIYFPGIPGDYEGLQSTWIDIIDITDNTLIDSVLYSVNVNHINIPPTMNLPDSLTIYEGMAGTTLIEDLRVYRTDTDTDEVTFAITENPIPELLVLSITDYAMNIDYVLENVNEFDAVTVSISDGEYTSLDTIILEVLNVNNMPELVSQPPDFTIVEGDSLIILAHDYIMDVDNILTYLLLNLTNATQTSDFSSGQITVKPTQGFTGEITDVVLQASDYEYSLQTEPFDITVNPRPLSQLTIVQRDFYTQEPITADTSWFWIRQLSPYEWAEDSVYFSLDGVLNVELPYGDYEINTTAANTDDGVQWFNAESYLGLTRDTDLKPFSKIGGDGGRCEFTLDQATDILYANKVMLDFGLWDVVTYMGGRIVAFGDDAQDAPFVWDLNFDPPDTDELDWVNDYRNMIQARQFNTLSMPFVQTSELPPEPYTRNAVGPYPEPGSNTTIYNETTYEIRVAHAMFPSDFLIYTFFIENIQAQYHMMDFSGVDPPVLQGDGSGGIELSEMGNQLVDFSDFWGAGYFVTPQALAMFIEDQIQDGNTDVAGQIMGSEQYRTSLSATVKDFPGLTDYLKKFPIESKDINEK